MQFDKFVDSFNEHFIGKILVFVIGSCILWNILTGLVKWLATRKMYPPGPIGLPLFGSLPFLGSEAHKTLFGWRKKYGDIIGLYFGNKYTIILNEYKIAKEVLAHPAAFDRAPDLFKLLPFKGFHEQNGKNWIEQRRFSMSAMRDLGLGKESWEESFINEINVFMEELRNTGGKPTDISEALTNSLSTNMLHLLIGRKLEKEKEIDKIKLAIKFTKSALTFLGPSEPANLIPGLRKILEVTRLFGYRKAAEHVKKFSSFMKEEIARHKTSDSMHTHDLINTYLKHIDRLSYSKINDHVFSEDMLLGNLCVLFLGGSDTISSSMSWLLRLMADHQDIQAKVYSELMQVLGQKGRARYSERDRIPYTFAVLMEGQRFSSIVPLSTTRRLSQDLSINGLILSKGAEVSANVWGLHFDPNYWAEPERFDPERFLTDGGTKLLKNPPSYIPFSVGKRNCPGETIAWKELLGYFTEIVRKFEISYPDGVKPKYEIVSGLVESLKPVPLCFKERL